MRALPSHGELTVGQSVGLLALGHALIAAGLALAAAARAAAGNVAVEQSWREVASDPLGLGLAQLGALSVVLLVGARLARPASSRRIPIGETLSVRPVRPALIALAALAGAAMQFPFAELASCLSELVPAIGLTEHDRLTLQQMTRIDGPVRALTVPLTLVGIVPLTEELLFRGLLLPALGRRLGNVRALVVTALLFGLFHLQPLGALYATVAGLVLGAIALRTRSVLASFACHAAFNAMPVLLRAEVLPIRGFNVELGERLPGALPFGSALAAALALAWFWRSSARGVARAIPRSTCGGPAPD